MFVYIYLFICLGTSSKSACPHATCTMHYSIQGKNTMVQSVNGSRKRSMFAAQERTRKSIRNRREEGRLVRMPNVLQLFRQIGPEVLQLMLPGPREARLQYSM